MIAGCTIVSPNYLAFARTLSASYLAQHPGHRFFVLLVADLDDAEPFRAGSFEPVLLSQIGLEDLRREAMKYDILELNTNVKPTFLKYLIETHNLDQVVYLDPDIFVFAPLAPVFEALDSGAIAILTPHITRPVNDGKSPDEQDLLYNGTYNLGFVAIRRSDEGWRLLSWWEERCLGLGFSEGRTGLFVDQKWMNLAPGLFDGVAILRNPGLNMAYWNLHERRLGRTPTGYEVSGPISNPVPLCFFHFSGVVVADAAVLSRHTDRFTLETRPDLQQIFAEYKAGVRSNQDRQLDSVPYGFDTLSDGTAVTRLARRIYAQHQPRWAGKDPFDARGEFARFAGRLGLVKGKKAPEKFTWSEFNANDRRVTLIHQALKIALRTLGPNRYELLMRYLAHIAVLRHQSVFLDDR